MKQKKNNQIDNLQNQNFNIAQIEKMIRVTEHDVATGLEELNKQEPKLSEAYALYQEEEQIYKKIKNSLDQDKNMLEKLILLRKECYKTGAKETGKVRIIRQTSHLDKKPKVEERINWKSEILRVLRDANRFLNKDEIYTTILAKNDLKDSKVLKNRFVVSVGNYLFKREKMKFNAGSAYSISEYKDKYGLSQWVDARGIPSPVYMKQFMFYEQSEKIGG